MDFPSQDGRQNVSKAMESLSNGTIRWRVAANLYETTRPFPPQIAAKINRTLPRKEFKALGFTQYKSEMLQVELYIKIANLKLISEYLV
jgi:hypothetical protein